MPDTLKLPAQLFRTATFSRSDIEGNKVRMSISSDSPYRRRDWSGFEYWEVLDHKSGLADERLKAGIPVLYNHDRSIVLGRAKGYRNDGHRCEIEATFSNSDDVKNHVEKIREGILCDTSIGYELTTDGREIGEKDGLPILSFSFRIYECSVVSLPADHSVGIGRSHSQSNNQLRTYQIMPGENHESNQQSRSRMTQTQQSEHERSIREYATVFKERMPNAPLPFEIIRESERCILEGMTSKQFRAHVLASWQEKGQFVGAGGPEGGDEWFDGGNGQNLNREYLNREHSGNGLSIGAQIVRHREVTRLFDGGKKTISFKLDGASNIRAMGQTRGILNTGDFGSTVMHTGAPVFTQSRLTVADLLAPGVTSSGTVRYPREVSFTPGATTVPETGHKPEQIFDVDPIDAPARKIAAWTKISQELLQDAPAAQAYITQRLIYAVLKVEEAQILAGDGLGSNLFGIFTNGGVMTRAKGGDTAPDAIRKAIGDVAIYGGGFEVSGIVINPLDWQNIELLKDTTGNYLVGNIFVRNEMNEMVKVPSLWSKPVVVTTSQPAGTCRLGAFDQAAQLFRRQGVNIELSNSDADNFTRNLVTVLCEERALVATYAPSAFIEVTGL